MADKEEAREAEEEETAEEEEAAKEEEAAATGGKERHPKSHRTIDTKE